jgi:hypothetical protein
MPTSLLPRLLGGLLRRTWIVTAITIASCAAFAARAAAAFVAAEALTSAPPASPVAAAAPATPPPALRALDGGQLVTRNMFCSSCGPASSELGPALVLQPAVLIETSIGREPRATLRVLASQVQGSWGLGDAVPGLGQLDRISSTWVELVDPTGRRGRLSLLEPAAGGPDTAMSADPPAATPWAGRIRKIDEQNYEVDRDLVRELFTSLSKPGGVRGVPLFDRGELKGLRLLGVAPTTIPAAIGLQNRDVLIAIDGAPVKTLQHVIDLYAKLDQLSTVELSGTRDGKPLIRTLHLR